MCGGASHHLGGMPGNFPVCLASWSASGAWASDTLVLGEAGEGGQEITRVDDAGEVDGGGEETDGMKAVEWDWKSEEGEGE